MSFEWLRQTIRKLKWRQVTAAVLVFVTFIPAIQYHWAVWVLLGIALFLLFLESRAGESLALNLRFAYLRSYQWTRARLVPIAALSLLLSATTFGLEVETRWKDAQAKKERVCTMADVEAASSSVVHIEGTEMVGSGFWVDTSLVMTNNHVVDHNPSLMVGRAWPATVLATDTLRDIALLRVNRVTPRPTPLIGVSEPPRLADDVFAIGFPAGRNLTVSRGIVSAYTRDDYDDRQYIQTDAAISPGSSGGPVVDRCGRVVGMATQTLRGAENVGYAISWAQLSGRMSEMLKALETSTSQEREQTYPSEQTEVVAKYYGTLGAGELEDAYSFYSAARKARLPFESWAKGLSRTVFVRLVDVRPGDKPNVVNVHFYSTEETEAGTWDWRTGEFQGTWTLVREGGLWKMNESNIKDITKAEATQ